MKRVCTIGRLRSFWSTLLAVILAVLLPSPALAQGKGEKVEFEAQAPLRVGVGEQFQLQFTVGISGAANVDLNAVQFAAPELEGVVRVLAGPVPSYGTFMSTQGSVSQSKTTVTYTYLVQAETAGTIRIPAAGVTVGGKKYRSRALNIECVTGGGGGGRSSGRGDSGSGDRSSGGGRQQRGKGGANDVLLRIEVNKTEVYRGEPIVASLILYTQVDIAGVEQVKYPALNGFWAQELDVSGVGGGRSTIGGRVYHSQVVRQWLLYPQRAGTIEIEQAQFTVVARLVEEAAEQTGTVYDLLYGGVPQVKNVQLKISSPVVKIRVKELPQPQPEGFTGAVGQFELAGGISGDRFSANSAGAITVRLSGTGNFPLIEAPEIVLPEAAFEQFDRKTNERLTHTPRGTTGEKTFEYPFIARAEGQYTLPGVRFSYFDPETGTYRTLATPDFPVEVLRDDSGGSGTSGGLGMVSGVTKEDLRLLDSDIRFIRMGDPGLVRRGRAFLWSWGWFLTAAALVAGFAGALYYLRRRIRERADVVRIRTKKASKVAARRLKRAKNFMTAGHGEGAFFEELLRALWGYMGDKLAIEVAELTKERVQHELVVERGVEPAEAQEFSDLLAACELAQYSPAAGIEPAEAYRRAAELIDRFEAKI